MGERMTTTEMTEMMIRDLVWIAGRAQSLRTAAGDVRIDDVRALARIVHDVAMLRESAQRVLEEEAV